MHLTGKLGRFALVLSLAVGCACSSPPVTETGSQWGNSADLQRSVGPKEIILVSGDDAAQGRERYGTQASHSEGAFLYMGLVQKQGLDSFRIPYADELYQRGLYRAAFSNYRSIIQGPNRGANTGGHGREQLCEVNLRLAGMYFEGQGTQENWYLGYYHWREGLALADGPEWGSCAEDNFVFGDRYHYESQRKKAVDDRIYQLSPGEISTIEEAWDYPDTQRLGYLALLPFSKPVSPTAGRVHVETPVGHDWAPLTGGICQMSGSSRALARSEVFRLRSGAVWTLSSTQADGARTQGSAVAVSPTRLITNCHLIGNPANVLLRKGELTLRGRVVSSDPEGDRCILTVEEAVATYVASARQYGALLVGEDVSAIGNPKGLDATLSRGIIAQKRVKNGHTYIQTDAAISSGSSGGGLFDTAGNLVGITTFKIAEGESLNFAIAIDEFCQP